MNVKDKLTKLKVPSLQTTVGSGYISAGVRQGGSYLNNYHKSLPRLLLGSLHNTMDIIHITCLDVTEDVNIEIRGIIENEYLLKDIKLYVRTYEDGFILVDRVPYSEWSFHLSAMGIYTSNLKHIELKLVGINSDENPVTIVEYIPIEVDEDCFDAITEASIEFGQVYSDTVFNVVINGSSIRTNSILELKEALLDRGVEFIMYQRLPQ